MASSFFNKINTEAYSGEEAKRLNLPTGRIKQLWDIIKMQFSNLVKINLLTLLLCIPFVLVIVILFPLVTSLVGQNYNFMGNIGFGFPGGFDSIIDAQIELVETQYTVYLILIPAITLMGPGLAGMFYCLRNYVWGENVTIRVDYWKGIKECWKQFTLTMFFVSIIILVSAYNIFNYQVGIISDRATAWTVLGFIMSLITIVALVGLLIYLLPQLTMYNNKYLAHLKNSLILMVAVLPRTIIMIILTALPLAIGILTSLGSFFMMLLFFIGFIIIFLMWVTYVQFVMDKFVNVNYKNRAYNRGIYKPSASKEDKSKQYSSVQKYVNPKKKKPSEATISPLNDTFKRSDIAKFQADKKQMLEEDEKNSEQEEE